MRVLGACLVVVVTGCAGAPDGERSTARWVGEFPGQYKPFAACMESSTPHRLVVRKVHDDAAETAALTVSPPPYYAMADHEITVIQAGADKVRVVFRRRTAMDFGQTEQHVKYLAGLCGKAA